jgi:WD40 repeat protein
MESKKDIENLLLANSSDIVREKLSGHKDSVNSLDLLTSNFVKGDYLSGVSYKDNGLLLSASDDHQIRVWDLRINKSIMML